MSNVERKKTKSDRDLIRARRNQTCTSFDSSLIPYDTKGRNWKDIIRRVCWCAVGLINGHVRIPEWYCKITVEIAAFCRAKCKNSFSAQSSIGVKILSGNSTVYKESEEYNFWNCMQVRERTSLIILVQGMSVVSHGEAWE